MRLKFDRMKQLKDPRCCEFITIFIASSDFRVVLIEESKTIPHKVVIRYYPVHLVTLVAGMVKSLSWQARIVIEDSEDGRSKAASLGASRAQIAVSQPVFFSKSSYQRYVKHPFPARPTK